MSVAKREVSLSETLGIYLSYTPSYAETEQFRADLRILNNTLLHDSIKECQKSQKAPQGASQGQKRILIHSVYTRKVKELAALYPFIFQVENALRGYTGERLSTAFTDAYWWRILLDAVSSGRTDAYFVVGADGKKRLRGVPVNPAFIRETMFGINAMSSSQQNVLGNGACRAGQFFEELTLRSLAKIVQADWKLCGLSRLHKSDFNTHMATILEARNELFHGNPIKNRSSVITACERVLDSVEFHLGTFDAALGNTVYTRPAPSVPRGPRHLTPPLQDVT